MQGGTNTSVFGSGGDLITVTNSTGAAITIDDKVYINSLAQTSGEINSVGTSYYNSSQSQGFLLTPDGQYFYSHYNAKLKRINNDYSTTDITVLTTGSNPRCSCYNMNDYISIGYSSATYAYLIKNGSYIKIEHTANIHPIKGYPGRFIDANNNILVYNFETGELTSYSGEDTNAYSYSYYYYFYDENNYIKLESTAYFRHLDESTKTIITDGSSSTTAGYPACMTSDNQYLISIAYNGGNNSPIKGNFILYKINTETFTINALNYTEVPTKMQKFYYGNTSSRIHCFFYNFYNDVLILFSDLYGSYGTEYNINDIFAMYKYINGKWIEIPYQPSSTSPYYYFSENICIDNGMTRILSGYINTNSFPTTQLITQEITTNTGLKAYTYDNVLMTEATLTGYATTAAENDQDVTVSLALPPEVNTTINVTNVDNAEITLEL